MSPEVIYHLGYPKTATTTLQDRVFSKITNLKYAGKSEGKFNTRDIEELFLGFGNLGINQFKNRYSKAFLSEHYSEMRLKSVLLSDETPLFNLVRYQNLLKLGPDSALDDLFEKLEHVLSGPRFRLLLSIRRQDEMLTSLYAQAYANFYSTHRTYRDFDKYVDAFRSGGNLHNFLDYNLVIQKLISRFGSNNISVIPYELLKSDRKLYIHKLASSIRQSDEFVENHLSTARENVRTNISGRKVSDAMTLKTVLRSFKNRVTSRQLRVPRYALRIIESFSFNKSEKSFSLSNPEEILQCYEHSNRKTEILIGISLSELGYIMT